MMIKLKNTIIAGVLLASSVLGVKTFAMESANNKFQIPEYRENLYGDMMKFEVPNADKYSEKEIKKRQFYGFDYYGDDYEEKSKKSALMFLVPENQNSLHEKNKDNFYLNKKGDYRNLRLVFSGPKNSKGTPEAIPEIYSLPRYNNNIWFYVGKIDEEKVKNYDYEPNNEYDLDLYVGKDVIDDPIGGFTSGYKGEHLGKYKNYQRFDYYGTRNDKKELEEKIEQYQKKNKQDNEFEYDNYINEDDKFSLEDEKKDNDVIIRSECKDYVKLDGKIYKFSVWIDADKLIKPLNDLQSDHFSDDFKSENSDESLKIKFKKNGESGESTLVFEKEIQEIQLKDDKNNNKTYYVFPIVVEKLGQKGDSLYIPEKEVTNGFEYDSNYNVEIVGLSGGGDTEQKLMTGDCVFSLLDDVNKTVFANFDNFKFVNSNLQNDDNKENSSLKNMNKINLVDEINEINNKDDKFFTLKDVILNEYLNGFVTMQRKQNILDKLNDKTKGGKNPFKAVGKMTGQVFGNFMKGFNKGKNKK